MFLQHMLAVLRTNGMMATVMPHGVLFRGGVEKEVRKGIIKDDLLTRGLDKNGKLRDPKTHPEQFKDSLLGRIPKEWEVRPLGKAALKIQDGTYFSPKTISGPYRYLTSKNIRFGYIDLTDCGWISKKEHEIIYSGYNGFGGILLKPPKEADINRFCNQFSWYLN